jgi:hypothetical protein
MNIAPISSVFVILRIMIGALSRMLEKNRRRETRTIRQSSSACRRIEAEVLQKAERMSRAVVAENIALDSLVIPTSPTKT